MQDMCYCAAAWALSVRPCCLHLHAANHVFMYAFNRHMLALNRALLCVITILFEYLCLLLGQSSTTPALLQQTSQHMSNTRVESAAHLCMYCCHTRHTSANNGHPRRPVDRPMWASAQDALFAQVCCGSHASIRFFAFNASKSSQV